MDLQIVRKEVQYLILQIFLDLLLQPLINEAFSGKKGVARDIIALNAGAAIYVSGLVNSLEEGITKANQTLSDGSAQDKLDAYIHASNK